MSKKIHFTALVMILFCGFPSMAKADIYLSFAYHGEGNADTQTSRSGMQIGDTVSAYIWVEDDFQIDTGAFLDIRTSANGVIRFTGSEVFNPNIEVSGTAIDTRWEDVGGGTIEDNLIDEMHGFMVFDGTGILPSQTTGNAILDTLHDPASNAFLFGRVDFEVIGSGTTDITIEAGNGLIVDDGVALSPTFRSANVSAVPEPASGTVLTIVAATFGLLSMRRKTEKTG